MPDPDPARQALGLDGLGLDATMSGGAVAPVDVPAEIAGRYTPTALIGSGGYGDVWRAHDRALDRDVAVKLVRAMAPHQVLKARREVTALRWAQLPGVARLLDEGRDGSVWFIVMELVCGTPFPGVRGPLSWASLQPLVHGLLRVLASVHAAGILHLDLKPGNVLVAEDGTLTLLDFGVSAGEGVSVDNLLGVGQGATALYAAPEQLRDLPCDERADLYAIGLMMFEALAGRPPQQSTQVAELVMERMSTTAPPLHQVAPAVPAAVAAVVDAALHRIPGRRPTSAVEMWQALGGDVPPLVGPTARDLPLTAPITEVSLQALFAGPDLFLHLRQDAASVLWAESGGTHEGVQRVLRQWLAQGHAHWDDGLLVVNRHALDRLGAARMKGGRPRDLPEEVALGADLIRTGRHRAARPLVELGLVEARELQDVDNEHALLELGAISALALESRAALEPVLYELGRTAEPTAHLMKVEQLVRAAHAVRGGNAVQGRALLDALAPFANERLEQWRVTIEHEWVKLTRDLAAWEDSLDALEPWADGLPARRAKLLSWRGSLRYAQSRYAEAAERYAESARLRNSTSEMLAAHINEAGALLAAHRFAAAVLLAEDCRGRAALGREARYEALATWIARTADYQQRRPQRVREELVEAAAHLSAYTGGMFALREAAIAWRLGELPRAAALARQAAQGFGERAAATVLADALGFACEPRRGAVGALEARALACRVPDLSVQSLGLLNSVRFSARRQRAARRRAAARPRTEWDTRLDVISIHEALSGPS